MYAHVSGIIIKSSTRRIAIGQLIVLLAIVAIAVCMQTDTRRWCKLGDVVMQFNILTQRLILPYTRTLCALDAVKRMSK